MKIKLNNKIVEVEENYSIEDLIEAGRYKKNAITIWVNERRLLMDEYNTTFLSEGDNVKLIRLMAGG